VTRNRVPRLEILEDRCVPATYGIPWADPTHLTFSLAADGTSVSGTPSNLFTTLNAVAPTAVWQHVVAQALQTWAAQTNINFGLVGDQGQPLGSAGRPQGDPRFGDIRLVGRPLGSSVVAIATPPDLMAGTWSGDIQLNSNDQFSVTGDPGYDLYTVLMHEIGHSLGLPDSTDPTSVMYENYQTPRQGLGAGDIANIQALYGVRAPNSAGNNSFATATPLGSLTSILGVGSLNVSPSLNTTTDQDFYQFQAPLLADGVSITLQRSGISLLTPQVTLFDSSFHAVASTYSTDPLGGDITLNSGWLTPLRTYYVEVQGAGSDVFNIGSYQLTLTPRSLLGGLLGATAPLLGVVNNTLGTALDLTSQGQQTGTDFYVAYKGSINSSSSANYYLIHAPAQPPNQVMSVDAWGLSNGGLIPQVTVYDQNQNVVPAQVLVNENGIVTLQVLGVKPSSTWYVEVQGTGSSGPSATGGYFLGINFGSQSIGLSTSALDTLTAGQPQQTGVLHVQQTALYHEVLSVGNTAGEAVTLTITDHSGAVVGQVTAGAGSSASLTVLLSPGTYHFSFTASRSDGAALNPLAFVLKGTVLTDPIGPTSEDPTDAPSSSPGSPSGTPTDPSSPDPSTYYDWSYTGSGTSTQDPSGSGYSTSTP
jgi:hypothetical protein